MSDAYLPPDGPIGAQPETPVCVRHTDRPTRLLCSRCDRPACPACLRDASVGQHCVDCLKEAQRSVRRTRTMAGAEESGGRLVIVPIMVVLNVLGYAVTAVQAGNPFLNDRSPIFMAMSLLPEATAQGEWWRVVTSGFMHFGLFHLALNMAVLYVVGNSVEPELGRLRFTAVYLLSMLAGGAAAFYFGSVCSNLAGASGAVYGVVAAYVLISRRKKRDVTLVVVLVAFSLVRNIFDDGSLLGHVGGFLVGGLLTLAMIKAPRENRNRYQAMAVVAAVVLIGGMLVLRAMQLDTPVEVINEIARTCRMN